MKVGIINATYNIGSTGYLVKEIYDTLKVNDIETYCFWAIKSVNPDNDNHIIRIGNLLDHKLHALLYRVFDNQGFNSHLATKSLCQKIKKLGISIIQLHNLHSNYIDIDYLFKFCAKNNIAVNIILHDCWFLTGNCCHFYPYDKCMQWQNGCLDCPMSNKKAYKKHTSLNYKKKKSLYTNLPNLYITSGTNWICDIGKKSMLSCTKNHLIINDWVDLSIFKSNVNRDDIINKYHLDSNKKIILAVSQSWDMNKGIDAIIAIAKALKDKAQVVAVGNPNGYETNTDVKFIGYTANRQELIDLYYNADVVANTSRMETFGLVTVEAMACGTPVVAYDNTGTSELVKEGCGYLAEDGNIPDIIEKVNKILDIDKGVFSSNCKSWVSENFDNKKQTQKYVELFKQIDAQMYRS